jgi:hypothetical protein
VFGRDRFFLGRFLWHKGAKVKHPTRRGNAEGDRF